MSPEPPLDATGIARRHFSTVRKGYDPAEVRAYLHELSDMVGRLQRGEAHEHERAERAESRALLAENLDEHRLVELLGEETARVLDAARKAAGDIRSKAEESVARMVREAQVEARAVTDQAEKDAIARRVEILAEADGLRRQAEAEVERRRVEGQSIVDDMRREAAQERDHLLAEGERARTEAEAAAERIRASAREQGRRLVGEAQSVRERMLADLARRRRTAREQLERLNGARERLLAAYEVVRRTVDEATSELTVALPEARLASELAMRRVTDEPEETVEMLEAELSVARMAGLVDDVAATAVTDDELDAMLRELAEEEAAQAAAAAAPAAGPDGGGGAPATETAAEAAIPESEAGEAGENGEAREEDVNEPEANGGAQGAGAGPAAEAGTASAHAAEAEVAGEPPVAAGTPDAAAAERPAPQPQTEAEKWGVRLPRSRSAARSPGPPSAPASASAPAEVAPGSSPTAAPAPAPVAHHAPPAAAPDAAADAVADDDGETGPYVDELFARIRSERDGRTHPADPPPGAPRPSAADAGAAGGLGVAVKSEAATATPAAPDPVATGDAAAAGRRDPTGAAPARDEETGDEPADPAGRTLRQRDDLLAASERELARRLKRVLADEQNEVLDRLRRGGTVEVDDVIPAADEHVDRYAIAATPVLDDAAAYGAALVGGTAGSCDDLAGALGRTLVEPLRVRIGRSFDDCDGDVEETAERMRALYREWKANHIGVAVRHFTAGAYARGAYDATPAGTPLRWLVDRSCDACPDCDDNALAGQVTRGDPFPTGDTGAPAHPDCRCLVVPAGVLEGG